MPAIPAACGSNNAASAVVAALYDVYRFHNYD
jgi:hypothetical protein